MSKTDIEWADFTINPVVGCTKCSPGCDRCYALSMARRLAASPNPKVAAKYTGVVKDGNWTGNINYDPFVLKKEKLPSKPSRIFVGSMCDLFHEHMKMKNAADLLCTLEEHPQHTFLLLTKRPQLAQYWFNNKCIAPNIWLGVTVCNQQEADEKIPLLLNTPAAKRFISIEPMLGKIDIYWRAWNNTRFVNCLDWVIVGGETGPGARPMDADWARTIRDQCQAAQVPFFFKKMGGKKPTPDDLMIREVPR